MHLIIIRGHLAIDNRTLYYGERRSKSYQEVPYVDRRIAVLDKGVNRKYRLPFESWYRREKKWIQPSRKKFLGQLT